MSSGCPLSSGEIAVLEARFGSKDSASLGQMRTLKNICFETNDPSTYVTCAFRASVRARLLAVAVLRGT
jgi:hypothetical protein